METRCNGDGAVMYSDELNQTITTLQEILRAIKFAKRKGMLGIERDEETLERCIEFFKSVRKGIKNGN